MGSEVVKRVAKDGSQRGLHMQGKKTRRTELLEEIQAAVERDTGIKNWDPVVQMSVVAARAFTGYPAVDEQGNPIIDGETGKQVMVPPDATLAVAAAAKVAPFLHQHLRPKEVGEDTGAGNDPNETRDKVLAAFESMGVKRKEDRGE